MLCRGSTISAFPIREAIEPFAEFGIILLLFSIGLELSFRRLCAMRKAVFGVGAAELARRRAADRRRRSSRWATASHGAIALGLALAHVVDRAGPARSPARTSPVGRAALAMLLFEDLALVPLLFLFGALARRRAACERSVRHRLEGRRW